MTDDTDIPILPYDSDSFDPNAPQKPRPAVLGAGFAYDGRALTIDEFAAHVAQYRFGSIAPDFAVLHHTANPDASWAPLNNNPKTKWDRSEQSATLAQIKAKRKAQLDAIQRYYQSLGWNAGPHLFIDDKWIWLFTPMHDVGIHAKSGNSYRDSSRKLHYSIGIEVVGYYERQVWPDAVARNVGMALAILRRRLGTFGLDYRPGPPNTPEAHVGSLCSHRDFNKPGCPGKAITEDFYTGVAQRAWRGLTAHTAAPAAGTHYRVKDSVTDVARIRSGPRQNASVLDRLLAGDDWWGEAVPGQLIYLAGFGSSDQWVRSADARFVWANLLEEVKES
jgi:hypothetical protein